MTGYAYNGEMPHKPEREKGCHNCMSYRPLTAFHDDARGGWFHIGRCVHAESRAGLVDPDHICGVWRKANDD